MNLYRRLTMLGMVVALISTPALASGDKKHEGSDKPEIVEGLEVLNLPLPVQRSGRLINYLYVSTKFMPAPNRDIWKMRESTHFLREAMLLQGHRSDFSEPANPEKLDTKRMTAMAMSEALKLYGAGSIAKVEITSVDSKRTGIAKRYAPAVPALNSAAQP